MAAFTSSSSPHSEQLCQSCGTRPASNHFCQIINGQKTLLDSCDVCIRGHAAQSGFDFPTLDGAQCFYCGDAATSASMNQGWEVSIRQQRYRYTCLRCLNLYAELLTKAISAIPNGTHSEKQAQLVVQIIRDTDQRVRDRVHRDPE